MAGYEIIVVDDRSEPVRKLVGFLAAHGLSVTVLKSDGLPRGFPDQADFDLLVARLITHSRKLLRMLVEFKRRHPAGEVVLLSGHRQAAFPLQAYQLQVDDFIYTPCAPEAILRRLAFSLRRVRLRKLKELSSQEAAPVNGQVLAKLYQGQRASRSRSSLEAVCGSLQAGTAASA